MCLGGRRIVSGTYGDGRIGFFDPEDVFVIFVVEVFIIGHGCEGYV